jgi:thiol:disulfide interchange protein
LGSGCAAQPVLLADTAVERRIYQLRITFVDQPEENSVTTIEAVIFGMMLAWTPCVLLMAYLLWRAPSEPG